MFLAETIKHARVAAGLTQIDLAERMGVTQTTVWRWEEGQAAPRVDKLNDLADALGLDYNHLLELAVQAATDRAARRTNQRVPLHVIRNEPTDHAPGRDKAPTERGRRVGALHEERLTALEEQFSALLRRVADLAEALEHAGVVVPAKDGDGSGGRATQPKRGEPPSVRSGSPRRPPGGRPKRS